MISMTYGTVPERQVFTRQFDALAPNGFSFGRDPRMGDCRLSESELWDELQRAVREYEQGDDGAGDWCSQVLYCLSFEWI